MAFAAPPLPANAARQRAGHQNASQNLRARRAASQERPSSTSRRSPSPIQNERQVRAGSPTPPGAATLAKSPSPPRLSSSASTGGTASGNLRQSQEAKAVPSRQPLQRSSPTPLMSLVGTGRGQSVNPLPSRQRQGDREPVQASKNQPSRQSLPGSRQGDVPSNITSQANGGRQCGQTSPLSRGTALQRKPTVPRLSGKRSLPGAPRTSLGTGTQLKPAVSALGAAAPKQASHTSRKSLVSVPAGGNADQRPLVPNDSCRRSRRPVVQASKASSSAAQKTVSRGPVLQSESRAAQRLSLASARPSCADTRNRASQPDVKPKEQAPFDPPARVPAAGLVMHVDWRAVSEKLPSGTDSASQQRRNELFDIIDSNGNGRISLAEADKGVRDDIRLPEFFEAKPAMMMAYKCAKNVDVDAGSDDLIDRKEFRLFLLALRHYFDVWVIFSALDVTGDRRLSQEEFVRAQPLLKKCGCFIEDPAAAFRDIVRNEAGMIRFEEFADWSAKNRLKVVGDDDQPDEALEGLPKATGFTRYSGVMQSTAVEADAKAAPTKRSPQCEQIDWHAISEKLPSAKDPASQERRNKLFDLIDSNGNKRISLAEADKGVRDAIGLPEVFDAKPAMMMAYKCAKNADGEAGSDDLIDRKEFRVFLLALRHYFDLWVIFTALDVSGDRRLSREEFVRAQPLLRQCGCAIEDPEAAFHEVDSDGGGMILFEEFADWSTKKHLKAVGDDDEPDEALDGLPKATGFKRYSGAMQSPVAEAAARAAQTQQPPQCEQIDWHAISEKLPSAKDPASEERRKKLFDLIDNNGNQRISLAEADKGVRDAIGLPEVFDAKPAMMMAYKCAKNSNENASSDDLIDRKEFRVFLLALRHYFDLWVIFSALDVSGDRRLSQEEFLRAQPLLKQCGCQVDDPLAVFGEVDRDGAGMVLFEEFAEWSSKNHLKAVGDDDEPVEALEGLPQATAFKHYSGAMQ